MHIPPLPNGGVRSIFLAMKRTLLAAAIVVAPMVALADCPVHDHAALMDELRPHYDRLAVAASPQAAQRESAAIWDGWTRAPDASAQRLLDQGVLRMGQQNFSAAETLLTQLVDYCPDYPEGWNQRAFARYLAGDLDGALADLDRVLELAPEHFAALSGKGLTLMRMGRTGLAHTAIREATRYHPFLNERHLLPPEQKI